MLAPLAVTVRDAGDAESVKFVGGVAAPRNVRRKASAESESFVEAPFLPVTVRRTRWLPVVLKVTLPKSCSVKNGLAEYSSRFPPWVTPSTFKLRMPRFGWAL